MISIRHFTLIGLFGLITLSADGQAIGLPVLSPIQPRPLVLDTVTFQIKRSEYVKLELARKTLAEFEFTDIDQLITTQQTVITECEQALNKVVDQNNRVVKTLQDSLSQVRQTIQRTIKTNEQVTTTVSQTRVQLTNFSAIIRDARRFVWVQRVGAFAIGVCAGIVIPNAIKLIQNGR